MPSVLDRLVKRGFSTLGLQVTRKSKRGVLSEGDLITIKNSLLEQFVDTKVPVGMAEPHSTVAAKVIQAYRAASATPQDPVYDASDLWSAVYDSSAYLPYGACSDQELGDALFSGCRNGWLEGDGPSFILKSWLARPGKFDDNITARIRGRAYLRSIWGDLPSHLPDAVFDVGQPLTIKWHDETISGADAYWFYLSRLAALPIGTEERLVCLDLGSGSGGFAWAFKCLYPNSTVICCDLPETLIGAAYRLNVAFDAANHWHFDESSGAENDLRDTSAYDFVYLPGFAIEILPNSSVDLVVNTMSLSEMREETIARYLEEISRILTRETGIFYTVNRSVAKLNRVHEDVPLGAFPLREIEFETLVNRTRFTEVDNFFPGSVQNGELVARRRGAARAKVGLA